MTIIAGYGFYVLFKVVIKKRFWDFFAISIPFLIVTYALLTLMLYWRTDWDDLDSNFRKFAGTTTF